MLLGYLIELFVARISTAWMLMQRSFATIRSDKQLMFLPVLSSMFCVMVSIIVLGGGAVVFDLPISDPNFQRDIPRATLAAVQHLVSRDHHASRNLNLQPTTPGEREAVQHVWLCIFLLYLANYSIAAYFNVALVAIALDRLGGGHATLNDGLQVAWDRMGKILQWALLAATVGVALRLLRRRGRLGAWAASLMGYAWALASYFAIPLLAVENISPGEVLERSASLIQSKWGEKVIIGFSFGLLFFLLCLPGVALLVAGKYFPQLGVLVAPFAVTYWILLAIYISTAKEVAAAALYRYATADQVSSQFSRTVLAEAWEQPL